MLTDGRDAAKSTNKNSDVRAGLADAMNQKVSTFAGGMGSVNSHPKSGIQNFCELASTGFRPRLGSSSSVRPRKVKCGKSLSTV